MEVVFPSVARARLTRNRARHRRSSPRDETVTNFARFGRGSDIKVVRADASLYQCLWSRAPLRAVTDRGNREKQSDGDEVLRRLVLRNWTGRFSWFFAIGSVGRGAQRQRRAGVFDCTGGCGDPSGRYRSLEMGRWCSRRRERRWRETPQEPGRRD